MKTLAIGDIHGRSIWKLIVQTESPDRVVFVGDYFDSFDLSAAEQIYNYQEIINFKESSGIEVIMLIGNHDHHYFPEVGYSGTTGYQHQHAYQILDLIDRTRENLSMSYQLDKILFTHAGFSPDWAKSIFGESWKLEDNQNYSDFINDVWKYKPKSFCFFSPADRYCDPYGDDLFQSPIWIRPRSLKKSGKEIKKDIIQVVGHTKQNCIDIKGNSTGSRYYFIDTLETSGEYLIIENGKITSKSIK